MTALEDGVYIISLCKIRRSVERIAGVGEQFARVSLQQFISPHFHLRERKEFLSEILQRCSYVVDRVIDNHKAVVDVVGLGERDGVVLAVVLLEIQQKGCGIFPVRISAVTPGSLFESISSTLSSI